MELTKQDKKHIEKQVRNLSFRIVDESKEYMKLYEDVLLGGYQDVRAENIDDRRT